MQEKIDILSAQQYFNKYANEGIGKGADRWMIKRQLVDAFRREIFGLITTRLKKTVSDIHDIPEGDPEASRIAKNVIHDETMKWKKLCGMFEQYEETRNLLKPNDLKLYDEIAEIGTTAEEEDRKLNGGEADGEEPGENAGEGAEPDHPGAAEADKAAGGDPGEAAGGKTQAPVFDDYEEEDG